MKQVTILFVFFSIFIFVSCEKEIKYTQPKAENPKYKIGDFHEGGVIFHLDETGEHGFLVSIESQHNSMTWGEPNDTLIGAQSMSNGSENTEIIMQSEVLTNSAAHLCADYEYDGFSDWYLPAVDEMYYLYQEAGNDGYFHNDYDVILSVNQTIEEHNGDVLIYETGYWTSTENTNNFLGNKQANIFHFDNPDSNTYLNPPYSSRQKSEKYRVRAIRKF